MNKLISIIFLLLLLFTSSKNVTEKNNNFVLTYNNIIRSDIVNKYKNYYVGPYKRGLDRIVIVYPCGAYFSFLNDDFYMAYNPIMISIGREYENKYNEKELLFIKWKSKKIFDELYALNIISCKTFKNCGVVQICTDVVDTTNLDNNKFVLHYFYNSSNSIEREHYFKRNNLTQLDSNWYYNSMPTFKDYNSIFDFQDARPFPFLCLFSR